MNIFWTACFSLLAACIAALPAYARTPVALVNPGFEAGLSGWTVFTTANGSVGPAALPTTVAASINGKPVSKAAVFSAGQVTLTAGVEEGGGVFQWFDAPAGTVTVSADVAGLFYVPSDSALPDSARFWLIVDGQIVSRLDLGRLRTWPYPQFCQIPGNPPCSWLPGTASAVITGSASIGPGPHYVMIAITRVYGSDPAAPPAFYQFLDNLAMTWTDAGSQ